MQSPDITLLSLWSIFILEVIIAGLLFSERNKTKRFEKEYQKELKKTQEKLEKIVTSAAEEARTSLSRVSQNSVTASKEVASLAQKVQEKIEHTILNQTQETLKELQTSAKVQVSNLTEELTAAITHTKSEMHQLLLTHTKKATEEIAQYTAEQKQVIAQQAAQEVHQVTKRYLHQELSSDQVHELCLTLISEHLATLPKEQTEARKDPS